ncbi:hypothetical protein PIB30_084775 [Stylosanthes scabra]|uniref:Uncharacterized protein n=1 Tax=Stylosanthes scabra TaxID=79078 RepID=A0ABU6XS13_9FABA|nr:hypothetical protein [Stylosanthes scabra]
MGGKECLDLHGRPLPNKYGNGGESRLEGRSRSHNKQYNWVRVQPAFKLVAIFDPVISRCTLANLLPQTREISEEKILASASAISTSTVIAGAFCLLPVTTLSSTSRRAATVSPFF